MFPMGSIFFPLIVTSFKTWFLLHLKILHRSKDTFNDMDMSILMACVHLLCIE